MKKLLHSLIFKILVWLLIFTPLCILAKVFGYLNANWSITLTPLFLSLLIWLWIITRTWVVEKPVVQDKSAQDKSK